MRVFFLLAILVIVVAALTSAAGLDDAITGPEIRDLNDADFESTTQAATGATTGDWFLMFFAPWCSHCKHAMPELEKFSKLYSAHGTQMARIDCTTDGSSTCRRFNVKSYPTFYLLKQGKLYPYDRFKRTAESMTGFAKDPVKAGVQPYPRVPPVLTWADEVLWWVDLIAEDFTRLSGQSPMVLWSLIGACGVFFLFILILAVSPPRELEKKSSTTKRVKQEQQAGTKKLSAAAASDKTKTEGEEGEENEGKDASKKTKKESKKDI